MYEQERDRDFWRESGGERCVCVCVCLHTLEECLCDSCKSVCECTWWIVQTPAATPLSLSAITLSLLIIQSKRQWGRCGWASGFNLNLVLVSQLSIAPVPPPAFPPPLPPVRQESGLLKALKAPATLNSVCIRVLQIHFSRFSALLNS